MGRGESTDTTAITAHSTHTPEALLSRDEFRSQVFKRDGSRCVICGAEAADAHHIIERRLFSDGGYYLSNGASLCAKHHLSAEHTTLSAEEIRAAAGIKGILLPETLEGSERYDKWGNAILPDGRRSKGPLFDDESVQKALRAGGVLGEFSALVKYPRTPHLPWSEGAQTDDIKLNSSDQFRGRDVIVTEKLDGESTTIYRDHTHARSLDSGYHPSRTMVGALRGQIGHEIPEGWRLCGENLQGRHSISYSAGAPAFALFSVWDDRNRCLSWDETQEWAELLGLTTAPTIFRGSFDEDRIRASWDPSGPEWASASEGYVIRDSGSFLYREFSSRVAKFVRPNHVNTDSHWMSGKATFNDVSLG